MRRHRASDLELKWGKLAAACAATLGMELAAANPSFAVHPGINGKIAYTRLIHEDGPLERRAVFIEGSGQFTHPVARGENQSDSDSDPGWSSDGEQLAFIRRDGLTGERAA